MAGRPVDGERALEARHCGALEVALSRHEGPSLLSFLALLVVVSFATASPPASYLLLTMGLSVFLALAQGGL